MPRVRRWRVGLSLVAIAAALGWWGLSSSKPSAPEDAGLGVGDAPSLTAVGLAAHPRAPAPSPAPIDAPGAAPQPRESRIEGTVRRDGKPAAARVALHSTQPFESRGSDVFADARRSVEQARGPASHVAEAGEDGRFAFVGVAPGTYVLRAVAPDGASGIAYTQIGASGARDVADLALEPRAASLRGRVVHADGTPWRGDILVLLKLERWALAGECVGAGETDAEGRFALSRLPTEWLIVSAVASDGGRVFSRPVLPPTADEITIVWEADRIAVEGRVLSAADRAPVAGAEVVATTKESLLGPTDRTKTGDDGRFRILVPSKGGTVTARAGGFVPGSAAPEEGSREVEVLLRRAGRIRGLVTRRDGGGPVVGAQVKVLLEGEDDPWSRDLSVQTDGDGRFLLEDLAPASYMLLARGGGQVSAAFLPAEGAARTAASVALGAGKDVEVVLETVPGARIVGTVRAADGAAAEGATVSAHRRIPRRTVTGDGPSWSAYGYDTVVTGGGGTFEFPSLVPGEEYELSARTPGSADSPKQVVRTTSSAATTVDLILSRGRWIDVTVLAAETGAPVAGAALHAATFARAEEDDEDSQMFAGSSSSETATTDAAGRARVGPLGEGQVLLSVEATGFAPRDMNERLEIVEGPGGLTATVRLGAAQRISGRVLRPNGDPAAGAVVELMTARGPGHWTGTGVQAGEDGTFSFEGLGDGDRTVSASLAAEGLGSEPVPAPAGAVGLTLRLSGRYVVARVLDADGNPVPAAKGSYSHDLPSGGSSMPNGTVKDGRLAIEVDEASPTTTGTLAVSEATDGHGQRLPLGEVRIEGVRPGQEIVVRLPRELTIEGRVLAPDGTGVAGVMVRAERADGEFDRVSHLEAPWVWTVSAFVRTDATGAFRIGQLSQGPHDVAALPSPSYAPPATVRRDAGSAGVDFRLRPAASATVTVLGPHGTPIEGAQVVAVRNRNQPFLMHELFSEYATGWSTTATTSSDGRAVLLGLDPDATFVLGARAPSSASLADAVVKSWRPADATLRLGAGLPVAGVARDAAGTPLHGAYVDCRDANGVSRSVVTGEDGSFRFTGLAAGTVQLEARFDDDEQKEKPRRLRVRTSVPAGSEVVGLRLR